MSEAPIASAIVLNYNGRDFALESVRSLLEQDLPGKHHAAAATEVLEHPILVHHHARHDAREAAQHVIEGDEGVGQDHALDRRVRDVALVP